MKNKKKESVDKNRLSRQDIENGIKTYEHQIKPHVALETPDGKNNGVEPAVFKGQQKAHT
jgi:hypothetical protein